MKHGNNGNQTITIPNPQTILAKPAPVTINPSPSAEAPAMVVGSVEELLKAVAEGKVVRLSAEAKAEVEKFKTTHDNLEIPKRLAEAEEEATTELPKLLASIAGKHKVNFSGRKVTVVFKTTPKEGEPNPLVSFGPEVEILPSPRKAQRWRWKGLQERGRSNPPSGGRQGNTLQFPPCPGGKQGLEVRRPGDQSSRGHEPLYPGGMGSAGQRRTQEPAGEIPDRSIFS